MAGDGEVAGTAGFRRARRRVASAGQEVDMLKEARVPLERLAGYLETELATKEAVNLPKYPKGKVKFLPGRPGIRCRRQRQVTYTDRTKIVRYHPPPGRRHPRVSHHKGHITVSWQGDPNYHSATWYKKAKGPGKIDYEAKIFFKGTVKAPDDWVKVHNDFGDATASTPQESWDDVTSNSFVVITRNSSKPRRARWSSWTIETVAYKAGLAGGHCAAFNSSLGPLKQWHWFAFPGIGNALISEE